jgi:hypothetical protein
MGYYLVPNVPVVVCPAPNKHKFEVLACSFGNIKERQKKREEDTEEKLVETEAA